MAVWTPEASDSRTSRSGRVYEQLRSDILAGRIRPGTRLPFSELVQTYVCSVGAIREALQRLMEQGLVENIVQHGFRVVDVTEEDLLDLTEARCEIEVLAVRQAVRDGDLQWEGRVVAAHHVLDRAELFDAADPQRFSDDWAVAHAAFHQVLIEGCQNKRIRSIALSLRNSAVLYWMWSVPLGHDRDRDIRGEHARILNAVVQRDEDSAAALLEDHIRQTTEKLLIGLRDAS